MLFFIQSIATGRRRVLRNSGELWQIQQKLLNVVTPELMETAKQLLQPDHYEAVVDERSLEGLCGYPPCKKPVQYVPDSKRWSVNYITRQVGIECN